MSSLALPLVLGCSSDQVGSCLLDCKSIDTLAPPSNCATCPDCTDRWGSCNPGGAACKRGLLDLDPEQGGCEALASDAQGEWVMRSEGAGIAFASVNRSKMLDFPMKVPVIAFSSDDPECVPAFERACPYTLHALQVELTDFEFEDTHWTSGVATLNGPISAMAIAEGPEVETQLQFAFAVEEEREHRIALAPALVGIRIALQGPASATIQLQSDSVDFGGYELTSLSLTATLVSY